MKIGCPKEISGKVSVSVSRWSDGVGADSEVWAGEGDRRSRKMAGARFPVKSSPQSGVLNVNLSGDSVFALSSAVYSSACPS